MPTCYNCNKDIVKKDNANVLAFLGFVPRTFCNNCYSSKERGFVRHMFYFPKQPINSTVYKISLGIETFVVLLALAFFGFLLITDSSKLSFGVLLVIVIVVILIGLWQWILYFKAKGILAGLR